MNILSLYHLSIQLFLILPLVFTWGSRQDNYSNSSFPLSERIPTLSTYGTAGDTVDELGIHLMVVYQDQKNNYWFGSWGEGLYRYDGTTIIRYTTKDGLAHNRIEQILEDKSGNLFFKTAEGICKFDGHRFSTLKLAGNAIAEWKLTPDDLWFRSGHKEGEVIRYDGKSLHLLKFPKIKMEDQFYEMFPPTQYTNMSSPYDVYTVYKDHKGNIWFGTAVFGVCRYDGTSLDWITEEDLTEIHHGPSNGVRSIIEDKDGWFWFSNSLFRYDIYNHKPITKDKANNQTDREFAYIREKSIGDLDGKEGGDMVEYMSAARDDSGTLWIATYGSGVYSYDGKSITHYPIIIANEYVTLYSMYKDHQGVLWVGTHDNGVYRFNGKSFERFKL